MTLLRPNLVISLALALLTLAAYREVPFHDFIDLDDALYVWTNAHVKDGLTPENILWALTTFHAANWHPLTWLSLQLDASLLGPGPAGFHLTNLLLHTANVVLLFVVLQHMTGAVWRSALLAALFAVHPLHVESVAWVTERKDVLSALFWILTLGAYTRYAARPSLGRYLVVMLTFGLGLLAKPMLVTLPCVLLLLDYWPLRRFLSSRSWRNLLVEKVPLLGLSALACVITMAAQGSAGAFSDLEQVPVAMRLGNTLLAYEWYLQATFWPASLGVLYPYPQRLFWAEVVRAAAVLAALTGLAVWQVRRRPELLVGWLWFVGTLVPVIGLVQVGPQAHADRYSYIPHIGLFLAVVWGLADLCTCLHVLVPARFGLSAAILLALTVLTSVQVSYWHDAVTLWEHTLQVTGPDNPQAHDCLGTLYLDRNDFEKARQHAEEALRLNESLCLSHFNLGFVLEKNGELSQAERHFRWALRLAAKPGTPDYVSRDAHYNLGQILKKQGREREAQDHFRAAAAGT